MHALDLSGFWQQRADGKSQNSIGSTYSLEQTKIAVLLVSDLSLACYNIHSLSKSPSSRIGWLLTKVANLIPKREGIMGAATTELDTIEFKSSPGKHVEVSISLSLSWFEMDDNDTIRVNHPTTHFE